jgi:trans-2,3-dihydro-3-hydroxyanthranilate isomerase
VTRLAYTVADVFTDTPLHGNPVAVFHDADRLTAERMQRLAQETHLSETTFVLAPRDGGDARIRIFTPVNELPFAGHPILGTAAVLSGHSSKLALETAMGTIPFRLTHTDDRTVTATMRQPVPTWQPYPDRAGLLAGLGLADSTLPVDVYCNGPRHVFVGLPGISELSAVRPDLLALAEHQDVAVNCFAGSGTTWRMRMFSPAYGVAEDAATGSAAGPLAVHLARHGRIDHGTEIEIHQGVEIGRHAVMRATVTGNEEKIDRIEVSGTAVVVATGTFTL